MAQKKPIRKPNSLPAKYGTKRLALILLGVILILTALIYVPSLKNGILNGWDDGLYLQDEYVQHLDQESLSHFFGSFYLGMYQPLAVTSLAIDQQINGHEAVGYHATNLVLHLLNVFLVFLFIFFLVRKTGIALAVTTLFAVHPMQVETVDWIAARSTLLFSLFYLSAVIFYLRYLDQKNWKKLAITFIWFLLACFSKSMAVTLPLILFLLDYYRGRKLNLQVLLEKIPFLVVSVVFAIISVKAAGTYGHIENISSSYTFIDRIFLLSYGISFYLYKSFLPVNLSVIYSYPFKENHFLPLVYYFSPILILFLIGLFLRVRKFRKEFIFGILFFLFSLSPVLPFIWSRIIIVAERYTYLAYLGIFFIITMSIPKLYERENTSFKKYRPYLSAVLLIVVIWYVNLTVQRSRVWKDPETLLSNVIDHPHDPATHAYGYYYRANYRDMSGQYNKAITDYDEAIRLNPGFTLAYNNRGIVRGTLKDFNGALKDFSKAIELRPDYADAWYNLGLANYQVGNSDQACVDWKKAYALGSASAQQFLRQYCNN